MITPHPIPPIVGPSRAITYQLTRWDLFANFMSLIFRNRILQVFVLLGMVFNGVMTLGPGWANRPLWLTVITGILFVIGFAGFLAVCMAVMALATSFLPKQRGVVGQHVLEITEKGLIERTEFNEALHKWTSICRVMSLFGYLFIYVGDNNSHQVPKRCFSAQEIADFETDLRNHIRQFGLPG